jgi:hypothetical protein
MNNHKAIEDIDFLGFAIYIVLLYHALKWHGKSISL